MPSLKLFSGDDKQLYKSAQDLTVFGLPELSKDDQLAVELTLMARTTDDAEPWEIVDPGSYALKIGIFIGSGCTQLAFQNAFTDDTVNQKKTGILSLADAAMTTALSTSEKITPIFEIQVEDANGPRTVYRKAVTITKHCITAASVTVPPTETAMTMSTAIALFVPRDGSFPSTPCDQIIMLSRPSGLTKVLWINDEGVLQVENA